MTLKEIQQEYKDNHLDLETLRENQRVKDLVDFDQIPKNETETKEVKIKKLNCYTKLHYRKIINNYKETLDMTDQSDISKTLESIYQKYVNGDPLPAGVIKKNGVYANSFTDSDLTDLQLLNEYYTGKYGLNLDEAYEEALRQSNDELNDDIKPSDDDLAAKQVKPNKDSEAEFLEPKGSKKSFE